MRLLALGCLSTALLGQEPPQTTAWAQMQSSIEEQRSAVRKQAPALAGEFFILPAFVLPPPQPLGAPVVAAADSGCTPLSDAQLKSLTSEAAQAAGIKPEWLLAVVAEKSQGRPCALSPAGTAGLMQLSPAAIDALQVHDPFDPRENLAAGARLIAQLVAAHQGDFARARAAYDGNPPGGPPVPAAGVSRPSHP